MFQPKDVAGAPKASPASPPATVSWAISIQPRRRPSHAPTRGGSYSSMTGAQANLKVKASAT